MGAAVTFTKGERDTCSAYAFIRNEIFRSREQGADATTSATLEGYRQMDVARHADTSHITE